MTSLAQYTVAVIYLLVLLRCVNSRKHGKGSGLSPRDAMEIYRSRENLNALVPDNRHTENHVFLRNWIERSHTVYPELFEDSSEEDQRRSLNYTKILKLKPRPKSVLAIKPQYLQEKIDALREESFRRIEDDTTENTTLSKFFPRFRGKHKEPKLPMKTVVEVTAGDDDSLELIELEDVMKPAFDGYGPPPLPSDFQHCGFTPVHHAYFPGSHFRVVGGRKAKPESWPWMAALGYTRGNTTQLEFHCGGTLVSDMHVITAAHCVLIPDLTLKAARLGVIQLTDRASAVDVLVARAVSHSHFNWATASNDIAIVFLQGPVPFTASIHPICLPYGKMRTATFEDTFPFITGWGLTEERKPSVWLKEVRMPVVASSTCKAVYQSLPPDRAIPLTDKQLCCGFKEGGRDACQGDSGGPLMLPSGTHPRGEIYYLIGVVSLGEGCAQAGIPGVFTRITAYLDWLSEKMGGLPPIETADTE